MVWQEKGRQCLRLMKSSAKLHPAVIYYLGKQGCDARQITGPTGRQDTGKAGAGGWEDDDDEEPPSATAAGDSSSAQQSLWGICRSWLLDSLQQGPCVGSKSH